MFIGSAQVVRSAVCRGLLAVALFLLLCGCSRQARHDVLTFFFTGVPPLEEEATTAGQAGVKTAADTRQQKPVERSEKQQKPPQPQYYSHTVWLEGQCDACHQSKNLYTFQSTRPGGATPGQRVFFSGGGMPGELKSVADKLCSGCHIDKTALRAIRDRLWLHNPIAKGECLACHDPHQSKFSGVLHKPAEQICQTCHSSASLAALSLHPVDGRPCLECHNPHMGRDRILLRKVYQEQKQPVDGRPQAR